MQTKQQIQQLLSVAGIAPSQRLGQNFLIDLNLMRLLINTADIRENDIVFEVGCGTGSLTEELVQRAAKLIAVEIEPALAEITYKQLPEGTNAEIIVTDVLENKNTIDSTVINALLSAREEFSGRLLLVSNLPYGIACPVMLKLITGPVIADRMYVTVQKEVAERMTARQSNKNYGGLSILLSATGEVKIERVLHPKVFWPEPQVDSAMVSFVRDKKKAGRIREVKTLNKVVNLFMGHRRKMLTSCARLATGKLANIHDWPLIFEDCRIDPHLRPEQLNVGDYIAIANLCSEQLKSDGL